jgi:Noc2p family
MTFPSHSCLPAGADASCLHVFTSWPDLLFATRGWWAAQGVVRTFSANAKFSSPSTAAHLSFMATCIVELFGLDQEAAYAHAFTVRGLRPCCWLHGRGVD